MWKIYYMYMYLAYYECETTNKNNIFVRMRVVGFVPVKL